MVALSSSGRSQSPTSSFSKRSCVAESSCYFSVSTELTGRRGSRCSTGVIVASLYTFPLRLRPTTDRAWSDSFVISTATVLSRQGCSTTPKTELSSTGNAVSTQRKAETSKSSQPKTSLLALADQVPHRRKHMVRYYGAAHHKVRKRLGIGPDSLIVAASSTGSPQGRWARLLYRVFGHQPLKCECGRTLRLMSVIFSYRDLQRILKHLGQSTEPPIRAPPRMELAINLGGDS